MCLGRVERGSPGIHGEGERCHVNGDRLAGLILLVAGAVAVAMAAVLASGVLGGGKMGLIAGGVTVGSVILFAIGSYFTVRSCQDKAKSA